MLLDRADTSEPVVAITVRLHITRLHKYDLLDRLKIISTKLADNLEIIQVYLSLMGVLVNFTLNDYPFIG